MLFSPAVGPLFSPAGGTCWCCCGLLFVLVCPDLCPHHELTHVFITVRSLTCCASARCLTCRAWSWSPLPHSEEDSSPPSRHCTWRSVDPRAWLLPLCSELVWPPCRRHGRGFRRATCGPLLRVAGNVLVIGVVASKVCTANGVLHLSSGFALLGFQRSCTRLLWFVVSRLRPPGCTQAEALLRVSAAVAAAYGRVPRGQWELLDANMLELIDRSACLVEPVLVGNPCSRKPAPGTSQRRVRRCSRISPSRGLEEGLVLPELLIPSCSCRSCQVLSCVV